MKPETPCHRFHQLNKTQTKNPAESLENKAFLGVFVLLVVQLALSWQPEGQGFKSPILHSLQGNELRRFARGSFRVGRM